jgi:metallophosphoesterase (TIGR03767 family)
VRSRPARSLLVAALAGAAALAAATPAGAEPAGHSTVFETIRPSNSGGFQPLLSGGGENFTVRRTPLAGAKRGRQRRRQSIGFFAQITDPQLADEMSPARVEFVDPAGPPLTASWRPMEALGPYVFDSIVRNVNRNRTSKVRGRGGKRARLNYAITTGDLADNQQQNETKWIVDIMNGGFVDPFSGQSLSANNDCATDEATKRRLNADVSARRYTGVQDYSDYPSAPPSRYQGYWDPDRPIGAGNYANFPRYAGLMNRAQRPFNARGLVVPWYTSRGNHDGLLQGNAPATSALFRSIATGCLKVYPSEDFNPDSVRGQSTESLFRRFSDPDFLGTLLAGAGRTPPDPTRKPVSKTEYKQLHGSKDASHGFGYVSRDQLAASNGTASYYSFSPKRRFRLISLDTVAEGGASTGNLDDPQYRWLERELDRNSSYEVRRNGQVVRDGDPDRFIVTYGHHTLSTMDNLNPDEDAGACTDATNPGCDRDPRVSTPMHQGLRGDRSLRDLLLRFPNVVAYVSGHTHHNDLKPFVRRDRRGGFWEVNTASHVDFPQQSRLIDILDNRDGTLSIFGTMLNSGAPIRAPQPTTDPGEVNDYSNTELASISRVLAWNDPDRQSNTEGGGLGERRDRNAEMVLRDPRRRYWRSR